MVLPLQRLALVGAGLLLCGAAIGSGEPAAGSGGEAISLQANLQWQDLPAQVQGVAASPQGKIWYRAIDRASQAMTTIEGLKQLLAEQYGKPQPQFPFAPLLFEPSGRVWFHVMGPSDPRGGYGTMLLGYDGKEFVTRALPDARQGYGDPLGRTNIGGSEAAFANGHAFFAAGQTIYSYDGKAWETRDVDADVTGRAVYRLYREPDGQGIIAATLGNGKVWRWRDGKWGIFVSDHEGPGRPGYDARQGATDYCALRDGLWIISGTRVNKVPWNTVDSIGTDQLIAQLKADNFDARETATNALIRSGAAASEALHTALLANQNNEVKYRIEYILQQVQAANPYAPVETRLKCGRFVVEEPLFFMTLSDGSLLVGALSLTDDHGAAVTTQSTGISLEETRRIPGGNPGKRTAPGGVLRMAPSGEATLLGGEDLVALFVGTHNINSANVYGSGGCYVAPDGKTLWFQTMGFQSIAGVDTGTGKISTYGIGGGMHPILAVGADGRVFLGGGNGILVLNPSAQDARTPIAPLAIIGQDRAMFRTCSGDGTMWFETEQGVSYFDGRQLQPAPRADTMGRGMFMSAGNEGVLIQNGRRCFFVTRHEVISEDVAQDLVAKNAPLLAKAFSKSLPTVRASNVPYLHGDAAGNVWMLSAREFRIFTSTGWVDGTDAVAQQGAQGEVSELLPLGDNSRMLIVEQQGTAFIGTCADGKLSLAPLGAGLWETGSAPVIEPDGALWVAVNPQNQPIPPQAWRLTEKGVTRKLNNVAPLAFDQQGNLWVSQLEQRRNGEAALATYRDGKFTPAPKVSAVGYVVQLFPAPSGVVYVCTSLGLVELKPPATEGAPITLGQTLNLQGVTLMQNSGVYSEESGLLALPGTQGPNCYATYLFKLGSN